MTQSFFKLILLNLLLLLSITTQAVVEPKSKTTFLETLTQAGQSLALTGVGLRTAVLGIQVYAIAHYVEPSRLKKPLSPQELSTQQGYKFLVLHFLRNISGKKMRESYQESLKKNNPNMPNSLEAHIHTFLNTMNHDVKKHDTLELLTLPGKGLQVTFPQQHVTQLIASPELATRVWNIWFGPYPPDPGQVLQEKLLSRL